MKKRWPLILGVVAVLIVAGFFGRQWLSPKTEETPATPPPIASPIQLPGLVSAEGAIVPPSYAYLSFLESGLVEQIWVEEGDMVRTGDPLVKLDDTDQKNDLDETEAAVLQARADLSAATAGLDTAQVGLSAAQLAVDAAEAELQLLVNGASEEAIALAEQGVVVAQAGVDQAKGQRDLVFEEATSAELRAAEAQLEATQAQRLAAQIAFDQSRDNGATPDKRQALQLALNAAIANQWAAEQTLTDTQSGATEAEKRAANSAVVMTERQVEIAQAELDRMVAGAREEEITAAQAAVAQARHGLAEAKSSLDLATGSVAQAEAGLASAQAQKDAALVSLERRTLTAPFSGMVAGLSAKTGELISASSTVITMADATGWRVKTTDLTELGVVSIEPGERVVISVDAFPNSGLEGTVLDVARTAGERFGDVTYEVLVELDPTTLPLRWGMTAVVRFDDRAQTPQEDTTLRKVVAEGKAVPSTYRRLAFEIGGRVSEILVKEGQDVQMGDPIIRLETSELVAVIARADAGVSAAEASLAVAETEKQKRAVAVSGAQEALLAAQAQLALLEAGPRPEETAAAESRLLFAEAALDQAIATRDVTLDLGTPAQIRGAEAEVAAAVATLEPLQNSYSDIINACFELPNGDDVCPLYGPIEEQVRAQVKAAEAGLVAAQASLDALEAGATLAQRHAAEGAVTIARANRDLAQAELDHLLAGATPEELALAQIAVAQADNNVSAARIRITEAESAILTAQAALAQAQTQLSAAQSALERATLRAPFDGTVARLDIRIGEIVASGTPILTLADLENWQIETTDLTELAVGLVQEGSPVTIRFDALLDETAQGTVEQIAYISDQNQGDIVYRVKVLLEKGNFDLIRWGMTAEVEVLAKEE